VLAQLSSILRKEGLKMYKRPPERINQSIKIPKNYSGSAFRSSDGSVALPNDLYNDRTVPEYNTPDRMGSDQLKKAELPVPFDHAASDLPPLIDNESEHVQRDDIPESASNIKESKIGTEKTTGSLFSSLLPSSLTSSSHFPFGHGIGSEELLILAMMLMVFLSGEENDNEFLLMLGLLLFAG
jgi:hypothetical protein